MQEAKRVLSDPKDWNDAERWVDRREFYLRFFPRIDCRLACRCRERFGKKDRTLGDKIYEGSRMICDQVERQLGVEVKDTDGSFIRLPDGDGMTACTSDSESRTVEYGQAVAALIGVYETALRREYPAEVLRLYRERIDPAVTGLATDGGVYQIELVPTNPSVKTSTPASEPSEAPTTQPVTPDQVVEEITRLCLDWYNETGHVPPCDVETLGGVVYFGHEDGLPKYVDELLSPEAKVILLRDGDDGEYPVSDWRLPRTPENKVDWPRLGFVTSAV